MNEFHEHLKQLSSSLEESHSEFCKLVKTLTEEWNEKDGSVTCEFSTGAEELHKKMAYIHLFEPKKAYWRIMICDTCFEYHNDKPYHVEIIRDI